MKKIFYSLLMVFLYAINNAHAQNADQLYFNQLNTSFDYLAASFVVDTPPPALANKRAFLLWSRNGNPDSTLRCLTLDEFDASGNFISEHANRHLNPLSENLVPKKIIKSQSFNGYYLLGYVINSGNLINSLQVYSTPVVIKVDAQLNPVWIAKLQSTLIDSLTVNARI